MIRPLLTMCSKGFLFYEKCAQNGRSKEKYEEGIGKDL